MFDLTAHLTPDISWRKASGAGAITPAFQADFTALSALPAGVSLSRAGNSMVYDSTGKLTYAPNNLLTYSEDLTNAAWTLSNATIVGGVSDPLGGNNAFTLTATGASGWIRQVPGAGANALTQVWLRRRTGTGNTQLFLPNSAGNAVTLTSSWQQFSANANAPAGLWFLVQCDISGDAIDIFQPQGQLVTYETLPRTYNPTTSAAYYGPRSDFAWNGSAWVAIGLLIEEQRTNSLTHSGTFTVDWNVAGTTISNAGTAPDGGSAVKLTEDVSSGSHGIYTPSSLSPAAFCATVYAKAAERRYLTLCGGASNYATFDLTGGAVTASNSGVTTFMQPLGNGWYRCGVSKPTVTVDFVVIGISDTAVPSSPDAYGRPSYTSDGTSGLYIWGAQVEPGTFPTSYIPTTTAAVTRSADIAQLTGAALAALSGGAGSLFLETGGYSNVGNGVLFSFITVSPADQIYPVNVNHVTYYSGGSDYTTAAIGPGGIGRNVDNVRFGFGWDGTGNSLVSNGGTVVTSSHVLVTVTSPQIGQYNSRSQMDGLVRSIAIYTSRLSDADLQSKSVVGASF